MPYRNYKTGWYFWAFSYAIALEVLDIHMFFYTSSLILSVNHFGSYFSSWATRF